MDRLLLSLPNHRQLVETLFAYDVVGFQTADALDAFRDYVIQEMGGTIGEDGRITVGARSMLAIACPIGIDTANFLEASQSTAARYAFYRSGDGTWQLGSTQEGLFYVHAEGLRIYLPADLPRGVHTLAFRVADEAGNIGSVSTTFKVK